MNQNMTCFKINYSKTHHFDFQQGLLQYYDELCLEVPSVFVNLMAPKMKKVGNAKGFILISLLFKIRFPFHRLWILEHLFLPRSAIFLVQHYSSVSPIE